MSNLTPEEFAAKTLKRITDLKRAAFLGVATDVVMLSPVGNPDGWDMTEEEKESVRRSGYVGGRFRANWRFGVGNLNPTTSTATDRTGSVTIKRISSGVLKAPADPDYYLSNSLPYAMRLEYDGWSHTQAPEGMVRKTVTRWQVIVSEELRKIKAAD